MLKFACPSDVGITTLIDKSLFTLKVKVPAVRIVKALSKAAREALPVLALARRQSIVSSVEDSFSNLVLLCDDIPLTAAQHAFIASSKAEITSYELTLDYSSWTAQDILRSILPMELEVPSSFETVGHIAHMNLRDQYQSYKSIIAAKSKNIRTVVNKLDSIQHTFRFFKMEVLAGDEDLFISNLVESKCRFSFDFSKVYWNSRLQSEHARLIEQFKSSDKICDVMAGIGPFALPSAKKGSLVFANDLNPDSFTYLSANIIANKLEHIVKPYNMDGRDFIATALRDLNDAECLNALSTMQKNAKKVIAATTAPSISNERQPETLKLFDHYIMNLPATAIEFLDAFKGLYSTYNIPEGATMPLVHCYCFSTAEDYKCDAMERCSQVLGYDLDNADIVSIHHVRNVAPKKAMLCISIRMPREILFECNEKIVKKAKHD